MTAAELAPPPSPIDAIIAGGLPPESLDPLADGILMEHQKAWVADKSPLKLCEKGRRTGITFAEALDSTLIAASRRSAGGDNTWYIGDTKEKGREFIAVCARFARHVAKELLEVEEFLFEDTRADGSSQQITAFRIRFASGFQVAALSSRPANIRGLQGRVVIDEAAFHPDVSGVIDACNALLIWGGVIRIISTHNGNANAFNDLIKQTREGKYDYSLHRYAFDDAVANGLYERVCLIAGWEPSPQGKADWYKRVRRSYGSRTEAMKEELDAIPREGDGVAIPLAWIEACSNPEFKVARWSPPAEDFVDWPERRRQGEMLLWLEEHVGPVLDKFPNLPSAFGEDFGMRADRSCIAAGYTGQDLVRRVPLIVELDRCPYDQQKQALFYIVKRLKRFQGGILDANGNGMPLAQEARQKFGVERIIELIASDAWYREFATKFRAAFEERMIEIPVDLDVRDDVHEFRTINGVIKIPNEVRKPSKTVKNAPKRHADSGIALLNFHVASQADWVKIEFMSTGQGRAGHQGFADLQDRAGGDRLRDTGWGSVGGVNDFGGF